MDTQQRNRRPQRPDGQKRRVAAQPASAPRPKQASRKRKKKTSLFGGRASQKNYTSRQELESKLLRQNASLKTKKNVRKPRRPAQPMVYTQPQVFNRNRLLLNLLITAAVVLALVMGMSIFFKVETIMVSGANAYSEWAVREASGIEVGDNLFSLADARASGRIQAELPYVNSVRIGIKLPDTVIIYIEELEVAYAAKCNNGIWWLITSGGRVVEQIDERKASGYTEIKGITLQDPVVNQRAVAVEDSPTGSAATDAAGETVQPVISGESTPVTVTNAQRLQAALDILTALELNDIVGEAASVDVTNLNAIELWYGRRYQVNLGDTSNLEYKIACMKKAIAQLGDYEMGVLDVSFVTWKTEVGYTPFSE